MGVADFLRGQRTRANGAPRALDLRVTWRGADLMRGPWRPLERFAGRGALEDWLGAPLLPEVMADGDLVNVETWRAGTPTSVRRMALRHGALVPLPIPTREEWGYHGFWRATDARAGWVGLWEADAYDRSPKATAVILPEERLHALRHRMPASVQGLLVCEAMELALGRSPPARRALDGLAPDFLVWIKRLYASLALRRDLPGVDDALRALWRRLVNMEAPPAGLDPRTRAVQRAARRLLSHGMNFVDEGAGWSSEPVELRLCGAVVALSTLDLPSGLASAEDIAWLTELFRARVPTRLLVRLLTGSSEDVLPELLTPYRDAIDAAR